MRRIFGPKGDEVTGECRRLRNEKPNDLCCTPNIVRVIKARKMKRAGHEARIGERRGALGFWSGKQEGKRRLGRPWHTWEDNIKMDHQEVR